MRVRDSWGLDLRGIEPLTSSMPSTRSWVALFPPFRPLSAPIATGSVSGASWWLKASLALNLSVRHDQRDQNRQTSWASTGPYR